MRKRLAQIIKSKPFILKLFFSFLFLGCVTVILINIFSYIITLNFNRNELGEAYIDNLRVADTIFKMWDEEIKNQVLVISMNENLNNLQSEMDIHDDLSNILKISTYLRDILITNSKYYQVSIIIEDWDLVITSNYGAITIREMFGHIDNDYMHMLEDNFSGVYNYSLSLRGLPVTQRREYVITYVTPLMSYVTHKRGIIIFDLQERELNKVINGGNSNGSIFIIDSEGLVISDQNVEKIGTNLSSVPAVQRIFSNGDPSGFFVTRIDNKQYFVNYLKSNLNDWYYCSFIPVDDFYDKMRVMAILAIASICIFLVLSALFSFLFAKNINNPLKKIVSKIKNYDEIPFNEKSNELDQISIALDNFTQKIKQDEKIISDYFLINLLTGSLDGNLENGQNPSPLQDPNICCAVICIDNYQKVLDKHGDTQLNVFIRQILDTFLSGLSDRLNCYGIILGNNNIALLMNFMDIDMGLIKSDIIMIQDEISKNIGISISIGVGQICQTDQAPFSYNTAMRALSRKMIVGYGSLSFFQGEIVQDYFYPYENEKIIFNNLKLNDVKKTRQALSVFFNELKSRKNISVDNYIIAFNQLMVNIIKYLVDLRINSQDIFDTELNIYHYLSKFEFIDEIEAFLQEILEKIINFQLKNSIQRTDYIVKILDYIKLNYDKKFDINALSDQIGLSYSYVRRVFADNMGENILHYVYKQKVEVSKQMLLETNLTINEIYEKLGFYNKQSFYRFFRKFEGITPHEYRILEIEKNKPQVS